MLLVLFVAGLCLFGVTATASAEWLSLPTPSLSTPSVSTPSLSTPLLSASESSLLRAMNAARGTAGLGPLHQDPALERAARAHSTDMLRKQYFAHGSFLSRIVSFHARGPVFGENLAWGTSATATWVVSQWLASPEHRANLLRPGFRRVGIGEVSGTFSGSAGATVVTADFAGR